MLVHQFLRSVWPRNGNCFSLFSLRTDTKHRKHIWIHPTDTQAIDTFITTTRNNHQNAFFALASFHKQSRKQGNVAAVRSLWADLDVGEHPKPYITQAQALEALIHFCNTTQFPRPTWLINSGRGLQAYWVGDEDLTLEQWQLVAERFFTFCQTNNLKVDAAVAKDAARVLRLPTSLHCKDLNDLREVEVLDQQAECTWGDIIPRLPAPALPPPPPQIVPTETNLALTLSLGSISHTPKCFGTIIRRTYQGHGCPAMLHAVQFSGGLSEPAWRAALSQAKFCTDVQEGVYAVSAMHPEYSVARTQEKLNGITGPYGCAAISEMDDYREHCLACPNRGKVKAPISLGATVPTAVPETPDSTPTSAPAIDAPDHPLNVILENRPAPSSQNTAPFPYTISKDGYTYKALTEKEAKEAVKQEISLYTTPEGATVKRAYHGTITLLGRAYDVIEGEEIAQLAVVRGKDKGRFAKVPLKDVGSKDMLRKALRQGAILNEAEAAVVQDYVSRAILHDKEHTKATTAVTHGGWNPSMSGFIYGRWVMQHDGSIANVIPLAGMDTLTRVMQVKGSTSHWVRMADYWNKPRHNAMAFTLLTTFGAPLMKMMQMGTAGGLIHLFSPESGVGKSAVQNMICAAYGNPRLMIMTPQDTINSMMSLIGTYCNTPICIDEITNHPPEEVSRLIYQFSQGREKTRMDANMQIRPTSGDWNTIIVSSGNASLIDKLCSLKASPEGELMRFLELRPEPLDVDEPLSEVMQGIYDNYGSVGVKYLYNVVAYQHVVKQEIQYVKDYINARSSMGQSYRFWTALCVANLAGGRLAKRLGLIDYDMDALADWVIQTVNTLVATLEARIMRGGNVFGNLLASLANHIITVPEQGRAILPSRDPRVLVNMRTRKVSISVSALTHAAAAQQVSVVDMTLRLQDARYRFIGQTETNLAADIPEYMAPLNVPVYEYTFAGETA